MASSRFHAPRSISLLQKVYSFWSSLPMQPPPKGRRKRYRNQKSCKAWIKVRGLPHAIAWQLSAIFCSRPASSGRSFFISRALSICFSMNSRTPMYTPCTACLYTAVSSVSSAVLLAVSSRTPWTPYFSTASPMGKWTLSSPKAFLKRFLLKTGLCSPAKRPLWGMCIS